MAMSNNEIAGKLIGLVQLDIDAVHAYRQTLPLIGSVILADQLVRFRCDHERHIDQLSAVIRAFEVEPPSRFMDFQGFLTEGFQALENQVETGEALLAIKANEELINKTYRDVSLLDLTPNIKELVIRNHSDEQTHLYFITEVLADRRWER